MKSTIFSFHSSGLAQNAFSSTSIWWTERKTFQSLAKLRRICATSWGACRELLALFDVLIGPVAPIRMPLPEPPVAVPVLALELLLEVMLLHDSMFEKYSILFAIFFLNLFISFLSNANRSFGLFISEIGSCVFYSSGD